MAYEGTITYNYGSIDEVIGRLKRATNEINGEAQEFAKSVSGLLESWKGETATRDYQGQAGELSTNLEKVNNELDRVANAMRNGAEAMQEQDRRGFKG